MFLIIGALLGVGAQPLLGVALGGCESPFLARDDEAASEQAGGRGGAHEYPDKCEYEVHEHINIAASSDGTQAPRANAHWTTGAGLA